MWANFYVDPMKFEKFGVLYYIKKFYADDVS